MSFNPKRMTLVANSWQQICDIDDANVTVENFGVGAYSIVLIIAGTEAPDVMAVTNYRTLRPQQSQTFTNLDEGTVLWARSVFQDTPIEVVVGS